MAYNVISCQKVAENTQILKIAKGSRQKMDILRFCYVNLAPDLGNKKPKKQPKTDHEIAFLLKILHRYGMF